MPTSKFDEPVRFPVDTDSHVPLSEQIDMGRWLRLLTVSAAILALGLLAIAAIRVLGMIAHTVLLFSLGTLAAYTLEPAVDAFRRFRRGSAPPRPRWKSALLVYAVLALTVVIFATLLGREAERQAVALMQHRVELAEAGRARLTGVDAWLHARGVPASLADTLDHPPANIRVIAEEVGRGAIGIFAHFAGVLIEGVMVLVIALYFLIYCEEMHEKLNGVLPPRLRIYAERWEDDMHGIVGGFVRGQLALAVATGAAAAAGCALLGVRYWLIIGGITVLASLVPVIGPYIAAIPAAAAAMISPAGLLQPMPRAVLVLLLFFIINEAASKILYPKLVGAALGLHEVLVLFVLFAGWEIGRLTGVLFAAPVTAILIVSSIHAVRCWEGAPPIVLTARAKAAGARARADHTP